MDFQNGKYLSARKGTSPEENKNILKKYNLFINSDEIIEELDQAFLILYYSDEEIERKFIAKQSEKKQRIEDVDADANANANANANADVDFNGDADADADDEFVSEWFNANIEPELRGKYSDFAKKINYDNLLNCNNLLECYFKKYLSMYAYGIKDDLTAKNISEITARPIRKEQYPFSQEIIEIFSNCNIVNVDFYKYCDNDEELPDTTLSNLSPFGNTSMLFLNSYNGTLDNLPPTVKCLSVLFGYGYNSHEDELVDVPYNYDEDMVAYKAPIDDERYDYINKCKAIIQHNTCTLGNLLLNEGLEWLQIFDISYINLASLPRTLKGLILCKLESCSQDDYYRDYVDFPPNLELLKITIFCHSKVICPDNLKVLQIISDFEDTDIDITMPDTLERLSYFGNNTYLKGLPSHLKTLEITITDLNFINANIPLTLEELIIKEEGLTVGESYNIDTLIDMISKLSSLKLLIIGIGNDEILNNFEREFRTRLSQTMPTYSSIKIYFLLNITDNIHKYIRDYQDLSL